MLGIYLIRQIKNRKSLATKSVIVLDVAALVKKKTIKEFYSVELNH